MTSTNLQSKRSEHGASLILLVSIIGLAFIVTVGAFLAAASVGRNTVRFTSAKMDVANREDVLMRAILQQTATAMFTADKWNTIMTNAVDAVDAVNNPTNYVDTAELTTLKIDGIPANTGDTNSANPLDIFNGYQQTEVPFGGTSGPSNGVSLDPNYAQQQRAVDPPLMIWSDLTLTLSSATALTTPQEFFLGSRYTLLSLPPVPKLSASNRWFQMQYPSIRFGYKQSKSNDQFIARRVWWRIPLAYRQKLNGLIDVINRYPNVPVNYILSVYEIPSQLPISGNAWLRVGLNDDGTPWGSGITIAGPSPSPGSTPGPGSIYGGKIDLHGGTYNGVSSQQGVNVVNPTTVGTDNTGNPVTYSDSTFDQPGTREQMALKQTDGVAAPVSVAGNDGKVLIVPVLPFGSDGHPSATEFYNAPPPGIPTHWDRYARPYYRCRIRVIINSADSTGAINGTIYYYPDNPPKPDQILGFLDSGGVQFSTNPKSGLKNYFISNASTASGNNILVIDINRMVDVLGGGTGDLTKQADITCLQQAAPQLYSIYIGSPNVQIGVGITDTNDLSAFTSGLSIVTNQTLYLLDSFNQGKTKPPIKAEQPPTSIYAPQIRYGVSAISPQVKLTGQVAMVVPTPTPSTNSSSTVNPLSFTSGNNSPISSSNITAVLSEVTDPTPWSSASPTTGLPPITALNLLFTIEKEQIN